MDVFPSVSSLPGVQWNVTKRPMFSNTLEESTSLRENRVALSAFPKWKFGLTYSLLRDDPTSATPSSPFDELEKLTGFFLKQQGRLKAFLYDDPNDHSVTDMQFAVADGVSTAYQLARSLGAGGFTFAEPVQNLNGSVTNIKDNGSTVNPANYSVNSTGLVTFNFTPVAGHSLTWTGAYYYRVRFQDDLYEFNEFMYALWELKRIEFVGSVGNKV